MAYLALYDLGLDLNRARVRQQLQQLLVQTCPRLSTSLPTTRYKDVHDSVVQAYLDSYNSCRTGTKINPYQCRTGGSGSIGRYPQSVPNKGKQGHREIR
eukprot:942735-Rhodomonas_salina.1